MRTGAPITTDNEGASAIEFALVAPIALAMVFAIFQLGMMFFANADLNNAVAAGARLASIYPRPTDAKITDEIRSRVLRLKAEGISGPTLAHGTDGNQNSFLEITMTYSMPVDVIFFEAGPLTLTAKRRVFTQPPSGEAS